VRERSGVTLETPAGRVHASMLVAADGLASPIRLREGLEGDPGARRRYGLRRHFQLSPWTDFVEIHFAEGVEAYVTPVGGCRVGVAFLWKDGALEKASFEALLARFPALVERLRGAPADSSIRGAGPLARVSRARVRDRFALLGDAAGYVDALTGEGLTLGFLGAEALAQLLPAAIARGVPARSLWRYELAFQRAFLPYKWLAQGMLLLTERPWLRRRVVSLLSRAPWLLRGALWALHL